MELFYSRDGVGEDGWQLRRLEPEDRQHLTVLQLAGAAACWWVWVLLGTSARQSSGIVLVGVVVGRVSKVGRGPLWCHHSKVGDPSKTQSLGVRAHCG